MAQIQAGTDPQVPFPRHTFWFWEIINIVLPIIGVLFLNWSIFGVVYLFYWELICWGGIGVLKILSASGAGHPVLQVSSRIGGLLFFVPLYLGLLLIVIAFSITELDTDALLTSTPGLGISLIVVAGNYLFEYIRSELLTGRFRTRLPLEILFERMIYALPLSCLVLFAVLPLAEKFEGMNAAKLIAVGIVLSKFLMDLAVHLLPGLAITLEELDNISASEEIPVEKQEIKDIRNDQRLDT